MLSQCINTRLFSFCGTAPNTMQNVVLATPVFDIETHTKQLVETIVCLHPMCTKRWITVSMRVWLKVWCSYYQDNFYSMQNNATSLVLLTKAMIWIRCFAIGYRTKHLHLTVCHSNIDDQGCWCIFRMVSSMKTCNILIPKVMLHNVRDEACGRSKESLVYMYRWVYNSDDSPTIEQLSIDNIDNRLLSYCELTSRLSKGYATHVPCTALWLKV